MVDYSSVGKISEWNEGTFKCIRLHEAQELINKGQTAPFQIDEVNNCYNYQTWKAGIDIYYKEGYSKYSPEEIDEVNKIKFLIEKLLIIKPPFVAVCVSNFEGKYIIHKPNKINQERIINLLEQYEFLAKKYNDDHGLSTRNKDEYDEDEI